MICNFVPYIALKMKFYLMKTRREQDIRKPILRSCRYHFFMA